MHQVVLAGKALEAILIGAQLAHTLVELGGTIAVLIALGTQTIDDLGALQTLHGTLVAHKNHHYAEDEQHNDILVKYIFAGNFPHTSPINLVF